MDILILCMCKYLLNRIALFIIMPLKGSKYGKNLSDIRKERKSDLFGFT